MIGTFHFHTHLFEYHAMLISARQPVHVSNCLRYRALLGDAPVRRNGATHTWCRESRSEKTLVVFRCYRMHIVKYKFREMI